MREEDWRRKYTKSQRHIFGISLLTASSTKIIAECSEDEGRNDVAGEKIAPGYQRRQMVEDIRTPVVYNGVMVFVSIFMGPLYI